MLVLNMRCFRCWYMAFVGGLEGVYSDLEGLGQVDYRTVAYKKSIYTNYHQYMLTLSSFDPRGR